MYIDNLAYYTTGPGNAKGMKQNAGGLLKRLHTGSVTILITSWSEPWSVSARYSTKPVSCRVCKIPGRVIYTENMIVCAKSQ